MTDNNTLVWVVPAISLGYSVCNDQEGKLKFWTEDVVIRYCRGFWIASDGIDPDREYSKLEDALRAEA